MTITERNNKLKHFITCLKCEVSGKCCDDNCSTQYDAGNMGEIIENLEAISKALEQETVSKESYDHEYFLRKEFELKIARLEQSFDKIRAEITDCLKALDEIEKSGLNIYLPNEMSGRRLTYQQCLGFIDKYKAESEST